MGASKQRGEWMSIYLFKCHKVPNGPENRKLVKQAKLFDLNLKTYVFQTQVIVFQSTLRK